MVRSSWKQFARVRRNAHGQSTRPRPQDKLRAECEALDSRQLLSTGAAGAVEFTMPATSLVTSATAILESKAPRAFAQLQTALSQAEQQSKVNPTDASALAQNESVIEQDIESANLSPYETGNDLNRKASLIPYVQLVL